MSNTFEITTPSRVEMRRLSKDEAEKAYVEELAEWVKEHSYLFQPLLCDLSMITDKMIAITQDFDNVDLKEVARKRSRDDLQRKRKMMRMNREKRN
jgi:hypothetical protein